MILGLHGLNGTLAQNIEGINRALSAIEENAKDSIRNALSKNLMSLSLKSQNANLDNIANTLNKDIISMKKVDLNIRDIRNASVESRKDISTLTESVSELLSLIERNNQSIQSLAEKSRDIGSIVALIDNIANQTNLLALNAAIEAAQSLIIFYLNQIFISALTHKRKMRILSRLIPFRVCLKMKIHKV